jgi:putative N6-adenine-specific DNA methylase
VAKSDLCTSMQSFYLVCPIGLEQFLLDELHEKFSIHFKDETIEVTYIDKGGIEVLCAFELGLSLNIVLRTPSKIMWRIKQQKCRDLPKLYNIAKKIQWKKYFCQSDIQFKITAKKSRIIHTGKMEASLQKAVNDYFTANKLKTSIIETYKEKALPVVFIRLFNDELTISIDTSGELLHIRRDRAFRGHASIRENIAALLLKRLYKGIDSNFSHNLIDPMCGTGTFLYEKLNFLKVQNREFLFQNFNPDLIKELPALETTKTEDNTKYLGFEIDPEILKNNSSDRIIFSKQDLFKAMPVQGPNIVIINPPYGKKIKIEGNKVEFFRAIYESVQKNYKPIRFGMIIPRDYIGKLPGKRLFFKQNGIDVCFLVNEMKLK